MNGLYQGKQGMNRRVIKHNPGKNSMAGGVEYLCEENGKVVGLSHFVWEESFAEWAQKEI